jgi:hypothetical protein
LTDGASHPLNDGFSKELAHCLLWFTRSSVIQVSTEYLKEVPNVNPEVVHLDVISERKWKEKMFNASVPREELAQAIARLQQKYTEENRAYFRSYFRKVTPKTRSTKLEIHNLVSHVLRGDYEDPFPPHQMSFVRRNGVAKNVTPTKSKGGLQKLGRLCGTNCLELSNKQLSNAAQNIMRLGQQLGEAKVKLCIQDHNRKKDGEYGCLMGQCAKPIVWMLQEANDQHAGQIKHLESGESKY